METAAKILVVDDERQICQNVEKILGKSNYEVVHALSAREALEKLATDSFALLISDIVMPGQNGLELLKLVKQNWPLTKAIIMTAYASTDTAMKAIRLGALDYVPKPFTPDELRSTVKKALSGQLQEAPTSSAERETIEVVDFDMPFEAEEVAKYTGDEYVKMLGRSDMPVVEVKLPTNLENYCAVGNMVCEIFKKIGATCKAGTKSGECPQKKAKKPKTTARRSAPDRTGLIGIDQPFSYQEVASVTGPEYIDHMYGDGVVFVPYEELKARVTPLLKKPKVSIDVDLPFDREEVAREVGERYADQLSRSDMPVIEVTIAPAREELCTVGNMVCDIFNKLGATCKAGTKTGECPQKKARKSKTAAKRSAIDTTRVIGVDQPFDYEEVVALTGPDYVRNLHHEGVVVTPYEELKQRYGELTAKTARDRVRIEAAGEKTVLVIDDEVAVNNNLRKILTRKGYRVDQATSKEEALDKIAQRIYQVVLLDLKMPGVKGLELLAEVRSRQPQARVIIITGYASIETAVETARMGAVDYLPKPFTPDQIRSAADEALRQAA
jgi:DNA-binding response OmpR family regulator